jgi:hypothetical protein
MVFGILSLAVLPLGCCCGVGLLLALPLGVAGIVLGFMARNRIQTSRETVGGGGKSLAGIVCGATATFIVIALGAAYLFFGFAGSSILNSIPSPTPSG